jgi:hypothetical protein
MIGDGTLGAMARLGMQELRNAVSLGPESVEAPTPYGMYGNITPGEVSQERAANEEPQPEQSAPSSMDELRAYAEARSAEASQAMEHSQGMEM